MNTTHDKDREILAELIHKAEQCAKHALKTVLTVNPQMFIHGVDGYSIYSDGYFSEVESKEHFVEKARLVCIARGADATALVAEAWMRSTAKGENGDLAGSPSKYAGEQDVVIVKAETRTLNTWFYRPLYWTDDGRIMGLAESRQRCEQTDGRFEGLLSKNIPSKEERQAAKRVLAIPDLTLEEIQMLNQDPGYVKEYCEDLSRKRKGRERARGFTVE